MCEFLIQKKALTFYSQSLICHCNALVLLSFIILPYKTSAFGCRFFYNDTLDMVFQVRQNQRIDLAVIVFTHGVILSVKPVICAFNAIQGSRLVGFNCLF